MTTHLTPEEFATALDGAAAGLVAEHLSSCAECRAEVVVLKDQLREVAAVGVPEPSPLFWDHFAARVRDATARHRHPEPVWWSPGWFVWTVGALGVALVLGIALMWPASAPRRDALAGSMPVGREDALPVAFDDVSLAFETINPDEADVFAPVDTVTWTMVDDLTDAERAAFVRLVERELEALP